MTNPDLVGLARTSHAPVGFEQGGTPCAAELVGRRREVHTLERPLVDPDRSGGVLVLAGEPGIGKSALLRRAERTARGRGFTVLTATGVEPEAQLPHAGLHQLLRPVLDRAHALVPAQRDALHAALGLVGGSWPEPFLVALAAVNLLTAIAAEGPVALVVDDVHWLDPQTQAALTFIAWRAEAGGYVVISAMRSGHVNTYAASGLPRLDLHGLDDAAADRLLAAHAADLRPSDRARIRREARGNPLALIELPAVWRTARAPTTDQQLTNLPARLERAFSDRIAEVPAPTRAGPGRGRRRPRQRAGRDPGRHGLVPRRGDGTRRVRSRRRRRARHRRRHERRVPPSVGPVGGAAVGDRDATSGCERCGCRRARRRALPPHVAPGPGHRRTGRPDRRRARRQLDPRTEPGRGHVRHPRPRAVRAS